MHALYYRILYFCILHLVLNKIPFTKIHETPLPYDSPKRRCFMPGQKISVKIADVEQAETGLFNSNLWVSGW